MASWTNATPTAPAPDLLDAMIAGEQAVIQGLVEADPKYASYVRRHRSERRSEPLGPKDFYAALTELHELYQHTQAPAGWEDVEEMRVGRALSVTRIYELEHILLA